MINMMLDWIQMNGLLENLLYSCLNNFCIQIVALIIQFTVYNYLAAVKNQEMV